MVGYNYTVILYYLTCKAEYHELSRPSIARVNNYVALTSDILPYRFDNVFIIIIMPVVQVYPWLLLCYVP